MNTVCVDIPRAESEVSVNCVFICGKMFSPLQLLCSPTCRDVEWAEDEKDDAI